MTLDRVAVENNRIGINTANNGNFLARGCTFKRNRFDVTVFDYDDAVYTDADVSSLKLQGDTDVDRPELRVLPLTQAPLQGASGYGGFLLANDTGFASLQKVPHRSSSASHIVSSALKWAPARVLQLLLWQVC